MNESQAKEHMEKKCPQCGATLPTGALEGLCPACLLKQGGTPETGTQPEIPPFQPPTLEEVGRLFPQLEITGLLGKGGMGAVYKARQPALDRLVALKILPPQVAGAGFAERFNREARALAKLSHANIVAVYEFGQVSGLPYFIMEFVDGLNLRQLEQAGKLSPREALQIVPQICEALQFAHDEGVVHRDIKPDNILVDKKGRVKIADFGIAKIMGREANVPVTETRGVIGTPQYMAPEQVEKPQSVDHRADIFSLGVVFYEMLTGELPLGKFAPPSRKVEVDVRLDDVVLRALEKEPELRYQQASQVKTAVETIAGSPGVAAPADAELMAQEILARDYHLNIGSCFQRAWALVQSDFGPIIGVSALMLLLNQAAWSTIVGLIAGGPLMGGLSLYYLKKIRKQQTNLGEAFSGFTIAFVPLFLGGLITSVLTFLGLLCLLLPGIYFAVIWLFTLTLIIDKRLDFWSAMRLSRTVVTRHFWKFLGLWLLCILMYAVGFAVCGIGFVFTAPIALIALTYAYEDIFGVVGPASKLPSPGVGPFGTAMMPNAPSRAAAGRALQPAGVGFALLLVGLLVLAVVIFGFRNAAMNRALALAEEARARAAQEAARVAQSTHSEKVGAQEDPPLIVTIDIKGSFRVGQDKTPITLEQLKPALVAAVAKNPNIKLLINSDEAAPVERLINVMDAARDSGIKQANVLTKEPGK